MDTTSLLHRILYEWNKSVESFNSKITTAFRIIYNILFPGYEQNTTMTRPEDKVA